MLKTCKNGKIFCNAGQSCYIHVQLCYIHAQKPWRAQIWPRHHSSRPLGLIKHRSDNLLHAKLERGFHIFRPSNIRVGSNLYFHSTKFVISAVQGFDPEIKGSFSGIIIQGVVFSGPPPKMSIVQKS